MVNQKAAPAPKTAAQQALSAAHEIDLAVFRLGDGQRVFPDDLRNAADVLRRCSKLLEAQQATVTEYARKIDATLAEVAA